MDKYEYKIRADEIKQLIGQKEYMQAAEIADTIDWRRVKSVMMLCTVSDLYKINRRYEDARDMLLLAYERRPGGRTICYSLCELSIKMEEFVQAVEYYKEFVQVAPKDPGRYILQYKLYEAQDVSLEERIEVLEELKKRDYREKWAYELAYLYHRIGLATRCVEECDELILWFGSGKYVIKAMELKMLHQPLSPEQQEKYNHRFDDMYGEQMVAPSQEAPTEQPAEPQQAPIADEKVVNEEGFVGGDTQIYEAVRPDILHSSQPAAVEDMDIQVKTVDVGEYNTINLQAELAEGLREVLGEEQRGITNNAVTNAIVAPMLHEDNQDIPEMQEAYEAAAGETLEEEIESEVFFGATGELYSEPVSEAFLDKEATVKDVTAEIVMEQMRQDVAEIKEEKVLAVQPPKEMAGVLTQESDGQIRLVMPESENLEKQITGQMSIEDILAEWERMKKENEEKRKEDVRQHVLEQTGSMFTEFEASVRDGLLEQLESGQIELDEAIDKVETKFESPVIAPEIGKEIGDEDSEDEVEELEEIIEAAEDTASQPAYVESELEEEFATEELEPETEYAEEELKAELAEEELEPETEYAEEEPKAELVEEELEPETEYAEEEPKAELAAEELEPETEYAEEEPKAELAAEDEESETVYVEEEPKAELAAEDEESETVYVEEEPKAELVAEDEESETVYVEEEPEAELVAEESEAVGEAKVAIDKGAAKVEREPAKLRALTREEKELYAPYIQSRASKEQLIKAVDSISMAAYTGNIIITGEEGTDTLGLAKNMIREVQLADSNFSGKVAKITGKSLNNRDVDATIEQLKNGALIIERASALSADTVQTLHKCLQQESLGIIVVLEDNKKSMEQFLAKHGQFAEAFTACVDIEVLSNDALVAYGKHYAKQNEFVIDELGVLALHTRIEERQTIDHAVTIVDVQEIMDEAIAHVKRKSVGHFLDVLFAKRYNEEDMIILTEKDFV